MSDSDDSESDVDGVGLIVPIQQQDVRRIVAGQVISDLASSVKELVDNSLDSGAKSINIRLFNQGLDVIEVSDDGCGVPADSRILIAMKHATSKIRSFDELYVDTYDNGQLQLKQLGFRGEALFSLANISQRLVISTRTAEDDSGEKLEFRRDGYLDQKSTASIARKVGTTVAVVKIFDALPVRRADLIKRIKIQRAKMLRLLQACKCYIHYFDDKGDIRSFLTDSADAILCVGVRFNLVDVSGPVGSPKCKTEVKLNTSQTSKTIKDTISQVLGSKFLSGLCPLRVDLASVVSSADKMKDFKKSSSDCQFWRIEGLVSKAPNAETSGKVAREIQFFSINGRPVELPKFSRVISNTWRNFESTTGDSSKKRPACILGVYLPNAMFDINVAPDKRDVLLSEEIAIHEALQTALMDLWSGQSEGKFIANEVENSCSSGKRTLIHIGDEINPLPAPSPERKPEIEPEVPTGKRRKMQRRNAFVKTFGSIGGDETNAFIGHFVQIEKLRRGQHTDAGSLQKEDSQSNLATGVNCADSDTEEKMNKRTHEKEKPQSCDWDNQRRAIPLAEQNKWKQTKLQYSKAQSSSLSEEIATLESLKANTPSQNSIVRNQALTQTEVEGEGSSNGSITPKEMQLSSRREIKGTSYTTSAKETSVASSPNPSSSEDESTSSEKNVRKKGRSEKNVSKKGNRSVPPQVSNKPLREVTPALYQNSIPDSESGGSSSDESEISNAVKLLDNSGIDQPKDQQLVWPDFSTSTVLKQFEAARTASKERITKLKNAKEYRKSGACKSDYEEDIGASSGTLSLSKDDFITMNIIGQFNLGFILSVGQDGHLWILDQHACDEKYNFEKLCKTSKIHEQILIAPLPLELSPSEENCVLEHREIFEKNGFRFSHDASKPPRHRLSLTAVPHSGSGGDGQKAVQFGPQDVGALCALLGADGACSSSGYIAGSGTGADGRGKFANNAVRRHAGLGNTTIRLPKSIAMFASRACRSSIMIGDSLTQGKMVEVVQKLKDLDHPWECAHGRPTIRHVRDLLEQLFEDE